MGPSFPPPPTHTHARAPTAPTAPFPNTTTAGGRTPIDACLEQLHACFTAVGAGVRTVQQDPDIAAVYGALADLDRMLPLLDQANPADLHPGITVARARSPRGVLIPLTCGHNGSWDAQPTEALVGLLHGLGLLPPQ